MIIIRYNRHDAPAVRWTPRRDNPGTVPRVAALLGAPGGEGVDVEGVEGIEARECA